MKQLEILIITIFILIKKLRPEYNFTRGDVSKIPVKQRVDVGKLNNYVLR